MEVERKQEEIVENITTEKVLNPPIKKEWNIERVNEARLENLRKGREMLKRKREENASLQRIQPSKEINHVSVEQQQFKSLDSDYNTNNKRFKIEDDSKMSRVGEKLLEGVFTIIFSIGASYAIGYLSQRFLPNNTHRTDISTPQSTPNMEGEVGDDLFRGVSIFRKA